ncbi:pirin family protein [Oleiagrimonas sp.]|jgi:redox-sensitive bicupin YhaK (pirin superfamily)|uniref:pirin family protein n=1 Tax=Oleiagrimonas sp. TaxID=2010330 RepID=UPI00262223E5|nr:pirin family protein [Oleiagrimonas sp.]MDA3914246.1 pirin family protein [Oleiagrimonas sp.]
MIELRRSIERGYADHGWLKSFHTFSFAGYHDPAHMGLGPLRVINEDRVAAGKGFATHGHRDMEILSYVLDGALAHEDDMGNGSVIRPGDVQRMSAGTGVRHSEYNHAADQVTHFLQIWILPDRTGLEPGYEQKHFDPASRRGHLRLIASADGRDGSLVVHQDARVYSGLFDSHETATLGLDKGRLGYVHVARGQIAINGQLLQAGDAVQLQNEDTITLDHAMQSEVLVFDLPR